MTEFNDIATIVATAMDASEPTAIPYEGTAAFLAYALPDGSNVHLVDVEEKVAPLRDRPRRRTGHAVAVDGEAFVAYFNRHANDHSEVWANETARTVTGVINADTPDAAGWRDHRITLQLQHTHAWGEWVRINRKMLGQAEFAEFIEERAVDFVEPTSAHMLEIAQTFKATTKADFEATKRLKSGETTLEYRENSTAGAGLKGDLAIPNKITLALTPFEGLAYSVEARFRYRITDGTLQLGVVLTRPEDILHEAFGELIVDIQGDITAPIWHGIPALPRA